MKYVLAVDGGGSKTEFLVADLEGHVRHRTVKGPSNVQNLGEAACRDVLESGIREVLQGAAADAGGRGLDIGQLAAACLGLAGLDTDRDLQIYQRIADRILGVSSPVVQLENDCYVAIHSGTMGQAGMALIAGTGSMAIGVDEQGKRARSGGWGYLFGDEGSAFDMGRQGVAHALKAHDGRGPDTALVNLLEAAFQTELPLLAIDLAQQEAPQSKVAALAALVDQAAREGDVVAGGIIAGAADELLLGAAAVMEHLAFTHRPLRIVLAGGAFGSPVLRETVSHRLADRFGEVVCIRPEVPPVVGACILALQGADVTLTPEVLENLRMGWG